MSDDTNFYEIIITRVKITQIIILYENVKIIEYLFTAEKYITL